MQLNLLGIRAAGLCGGGARETLLGTVMLPLVYLLKLTCMTLSCTRLPDMCWTDLTNKDLDHLANTQMCLCLTIHIIDSLAANNAAILFSKRKYLVPGGREYQSKQTLSKMIVCELASGDTNCKARAAEPGLFNAADTA